MSNFQPELLQEFLDVCEANGYIKPAVYQGEYSAVNRGMEKKLLPILRKHGMAYNAFRYVSRFFSLKQILIYTSVLASGFLSGRLTHGSTEGTRFDSDGALGKHMQNLYDHESLHNALKLLEDTTQKMGTTTVDAALRWAYYHSSLEDADGIILGASSIKQIESNVESIRRGPLPQDCLNTFKRIWEALEPVRGDII